MKFIRFISLAVLEVEVRHESAAHQRKIKQDILKLNLSLKDLD
jgi:hypothetical protein